MQNLCFILFSGCSYGEKNYINHVTFHDPQNPCRDCQCESGLVSCQQTYCPPIECENPIYMERACCPICRGKINFYVYLNNSISM